MAKKSTDNGRKSLVIVESPAKAKTISKFLGKDYIVEASIGHVRDLPPSKSDLPEKYKGEEWSYLGVNVNENFTPIYVVPQDKKKQVSNLKAKLKEAKQLYLATDEDREGEAISWHLHELLQPKVPVHRMVFHEITKEAIQAALENPREIDQGMVKAQETRRILDRLYGWDVSPLLWRKMALRGRNDRKLSAGRVQSVAVRLVVERERARRAFRSATYWDLLATFATKKDETFQATLVSVDDRKIPSSKDFDSTTGKIKNESLMLLDENGANELAERLRSAEFRITSIVEKPFTTRPRPPFTTSTMQQEANRKLNFSGKRTASAAQRLYENGHITYIRTDSTTLSEVAINAARDLVTSEYGKDYLPDSPRTYSKTVKNAQEAHEAIRPAGHPFELPETLKSTLGPDEFRLFELIWKRTIASQMSDARGRRITVTIEGGGAVFQVSGKTIDFPGFLRAYVEGSDDPEAELADKEILLPAVAENEQVDCCGTESKSHTTMPPARFTEASLTQELESKGIGRPSTYVSTIETIQDREYVFKKGSALVPSWIAFAVVRMLEEYLPKLVDYQFTAGMEDFLDAISRQEEGHIEYLHRFYFGDATAENPGLKNKVKSILEEMDVRTICQFKIGTPTEGEFKDDVFLRVHKYGPFLEQGEYETPNYRKASIPEELPPDELTLEKAIELLDKGQQDDEPLGICPDTHKPVFLKTGRFGDYIQLGTKDDDEKPKNAGLLKGMQKSDVTLEMALRLLSLPRTLGEHAELKEPVIATNGRYGPYIKCGSETRSLPEDVSPLDVTMEQAVELLKQPKTRGRGASTPKEPLKVFEASPVTDEPIKLLEGRYGPYVTDGTTNASLPKGTPIEEATFAMAVELLAERAARAPAKKKKKKAAKKKATKKTAKKAKKKKAAKKKAAKKKAAKKKAE